MSDWFRRIYCPGFWKRFAGLFVFALLFPLLITSCSPPRPAQDTTLSSFTEPTDPLTNPPTIREIARMNASRTPEEMQDELSAQAESWFYGPGLGTAMLNVGTSIVFPPYALYLLGNAGLALAGFEPIYITDALPETPRAEVLSIYGRLASAPGYVTSSIAGRKDVLQD